MTVIATQQSGEEAYASAKRVARSVKRQCESKSLEYQSTDQNAEEIMRTAQALRINYDDLAEWLANPNFNSVATDKDGYAPGTAVTEYEAMRTAMKDAYEEADSLFPVSSAGYLDTHFPPASLPIPRNVPTGGLTTLVVALDAVVATIT